MTRYGYIFSNRGLALLRGMKEWAGPGYKKTWTVYVSTDAMPVKYSMSQKRDSSYLVRVRLKTNRYI